MTNDQKAIAWGAIVSLGFFIGAVMFITIKNAVITSKDVAWNEGYNAGVVVGNTQVAAGLVECKLMPDEEWYCWKTKP